MMEAEQQQEQMPYYPSGSNLHANFMGDLTNPEEILKEYEMLLKGMRRVNGKIEKVGRPLLNEKGINSVMFQLKSFMNQVAILSFLEEYDIRMLIHEQLGKMLIVDLMINRKEYNIENDSDRTKVLTTTQSLAYLTLMRAKDGNDKGFWGKITMFFNTGGDPSASSGSMLSKFNPFKK